MNDSDNEIVLEESLENEFDFDDEPRNLLVSEGNYYVVENPTIEKNLKEGSSKTEKDYIMSINKLPTIKSYWECGQFIVNEGIRNVMARSRFKDILQNLNFLDNKKDGKSDKCYKVRSLVNHFNQSFSNYVSNDGSQRIDKHMVKFEGRSNRKQYVWKTSQSNGISSFDIVVLVKQGSSINFTCTWVKKKA